MCPNAKDKYAVLCFQPFCKTRFSFYLQLSCAINVKYKKMDVVFSSVAMREHFYSKHFISNLQKFGVLMLSGKVLICIV